MKRYTIPRTAHCEGGALAVDGIFERLEAEWHEHHHHDAPQPVAAPPIPHNVTQEVPPMSFLAEVEADAKALAAKLASVDHDALDALEAIQANPETAAAFALLAQVTRLPVGPGVLATAIDVLQMTLGRQPAPVATVAQSGPQQPSGPVVAGQA